MGFFMQLIVLVFLVSVVAMAILNNHLNWKWLCKNAGWHQEPKRTRFDGCSLTGKCPR